ncbi:MAG: mevalonate kinase [Bifidobacterium mongoliense]|jgi:mevalonate kinase
MVSPLESVKDIKRRNSRSALALQQHQQHRAAPEPHRGYGETWAKTILMGEHSVVYGYPAIAVPIMSLRMRAWAVPVRNGRPGTLRALGYYGPLAGAPDQFGGVLKAVEVAREFAGYPDQEFDIVTRSDFPAGRGLGSSAAASGAVIRAIVDAAGVQAGHDDIVAMTNSAEIVTHGHPSGLDAVTICGDDPVRFVNGTMTSIDVRMPAYLVIADSGIAGSTKEAVDAVRREYERDYDRVHDILERLGDLAAHSADDLRDGGLNSLGRRMNRAHALLSELHISHPKADAMVEQARRSGAVGAKMTGGGLGGCIIALAADLSSARTIRHDLLALGVPAVWIHPLNQLDVEVDRELSNDPSVGNTRFNTADSEGAGDVRNIADGGDISGARTSGARNSDARNTVEERGAL